MKKSTLWLPLLGISACVVQDVSVPVNTQLWDSDVVTAADGIYVALPFAESLIRVKDDASWDIVNLDGARVKRLVATPDGSSVLVFSEWDECKDDDHEIVYKKRLPRRACSAQ